MGVDDWCSHSADRCTSPQSAGKGGCDGTNTGAGSVYCPCLEDPEPKPEPTVEPKPEPTVKPEPSPSPESEGGRCCFHMTECPTDLGTYNEVAGCVPVDDWCSHSADRCTSPQSAGKGGCDGPNPGVGSVYCPCL